MAITDQTVSLSDETVERIRQELGARRLDGWLLFAFRDSNPIASGLLGIPPMLTRRYFVYVPVHGEPVAITHRIEQQPWTTWRARKLQYSSWRELDAALADVLRGGPKIAMEYAESDAVPYVDRTPAGVIELVRGTGARIVASGDLVSTFYSRWTEEGEASHRRASQAVYEVAHGAFRRVAQVVREGGRVSEWDVRCWIRDDFARRGLNVGADSDVAVGPNATNPHYAASTQASSEIKAGDLLLVDLWGKENDESVYADQTWMGFMGDEAPERLASIFSLVTGGRDAAVKFIQDRAAAGQAVAGYEADDAAREVIEAGGYGEYFIHRTGHSIDTVLHGSGPNLDNLETRDTRTLIRGVGFSVEPGIYIPGDVGFRSELNMFMGADGPEVTTPNPQRALYPLFRENPFA